MKKIMIILVLTLATMFSVNCFAENSTKQISIPENMLTEQQKTELAKQNVINNIKDVSSFVGLGKEIGTAVDSSLGALTNRANEFANTKVGVFTMVIVAYKIIGVDLIQALIGIPWFVIGIILWVYFFRKNCITRNVLTKINSDKSKEYEVVEQDDIGTQVGYFIVLLMHIIISMLIIFANCP